MSGQIEMMGEVIATALKGYGESSDRSVQSAAGIIGPSDLGFCRQKAVLMARSVEQTDSTSIAAAQIGTAIHQYVATALQRYFPGWVVDSKRVTATFPSGAQVSGTPDIIAPDWNAVVDVKTVDGFEKIKRDGVSQNHRYQRHTYALGALQEGLLSNDKPIYVGNLYIDRSGKEPEPYFLFEEFDPTLTDEIDSWIGDVQYAVLNGEDAMRDIPAPICERICAYFTVCRGALPVDDGGEQISDPDRVGAVAMYLEGRDMEKRGQQMKKEAQATLHGTDGIAVVGDKRWQIRWTRINGSTYEVSRDAYDRLDVRAVRS